MGEPDPLGFAPLALSFVEARAALSGLERGNTTIAVPLDLGRGEIAGSLDPEVLLLPDGRRLPIDEIRRIARDESVCYALGGRVERIQRFDEETGRFYKLTPTGGPPTVEISGVRMHRTKDVDPWQDTIDKLAGVRPVTGRVLDTTSGLGYTAILAARAAAEVLTIERDPNVVAIARQNPWSRELFGLPNLAQRIGDAAELLPTFPPASFDRIVHDPPTLALAGELYSLAFYRELFRVLRPGGRLYHYTGAPGSRHRGRDLPSGVAGRLREAGFADVRPRPEALGVTATRPGGRPSPKARR